MGNAKNFMKKFIFGRKNILHELRDWMKVVVTSGVWAFFPVILGIALAYWVDSNGYKEGTVKGVSENIAIVIMSLVVAVFLLRIILYKLQTDIVMLILGVAFLCREIHFAGTGIGVYIVAVIVGLLAWVWRDNILDELSGKNQVKAAMFCMFWSYLVTLLIQRRVFRQKRIGIFPNEDVMHISLEEITENVAHLAFLCVGLIAFLYPIIVKKKTNEDSIDLSEK